MTKQMIILPPTKKSTMPKRNCVANASALVSHLFSLPEKWLLRKLLFCKEKRDPVKGRALVNTRNRIELSDDMILLKNPPTFSRQTADFYGIGEHASERTLEAPSRNRRLLLIFHHYLRHYRRGAWCYPSRWNNHIRNGTFEQEKPMRMSAFLLITELFSFRTRQQQRCKNHLTLPSNHCFLKPQLNGKATTKM